MVQDSGARARGLVFDLWFDTYALEQNPASFSQYMLAYRERWGVADGNLDGNRAQ